MIVDYGFVFLVGILSPNGTELKVDPITAPTNKLCNLHRNVELATIAKYKETTEKGYKFFVSECFALPLDEVR